ncbi:MAG: class I SAM-dependent methyltransferase [Alphaproteobacteria bacterium]|nr:MAG: class I SAM-dependent methyltransferase [Alphaproteobacteria bacterium]
MDEVTRRKWDRAAANFELMAGYGPEKRWEPYKRELFSNMGDGEILFLALGTGLDLPVFPEGKSITAIDISQKMIDEAAPRVDAYNGNIRTQQADVHEMPFEDNQFDQVFTSCTFCSVPNPVQGLEAIKRVLKPGGDLFMFEHTGSRFFPFRQMMNLMTVVTKRLGPDMNRTTVENVVAAGYDLKKVTHVYMDVVKTIHAIPV